MMKRNLVCTRCPDIFSNPYHGHGCLDHSHLRPHGSHGGSGLGPDRRIGPRRPFLHLLRGRISMFIEPPFCPAAYIAAAIAGASPNHFPKAMRLSIVAYLVPFITIYQPAMLWQGTAVEVVMAVASRNCGNLCAFCWVQRAISLLQPNGGKGSCGWRAVFCSLFPKSRSLPRVWCWSLSVLCCNGRRDARR